MRNGKIDLLKCVAIYSVVFLHIKSGVWDQLGAAVFRYAVPYFFMVSGYFAYGQGEKKLLRRALHALLLWLAAFGLVLGLCAAIVWRNPGWSAWDYISGQFTREATLTMLLTQSVPFPYAYHIWYIGALPILYLLWWVVTAVCSRAGRAIKPSALGWLGCGLLGIHLALSEGLPLLGHAPVDATLLRNVWLDGLPFFLLGLWLRGDQYRAVDRLSGKLIAGGIVLGNLLALWEQYIFGARDLFLGTVLTAVLLMVAALKRPQVSQGPLSRAACFCGRALTFSIYAIHVPLYSFFYEWQGVPAFRWVIEHRLAAPFVIAALSTVGALAVYGAKNAIRRAARQTAPR